MPTDQPPIAASRAEYLDMQGRWYDGVQAGDYRAATQARVEILDAGVALSLAIGVVQRKRRREGGRPCGR